MDPNDPSERLDRAIAEHGEHMLPAGDLSAEPFDRLLRGDPPGRAEDLVAEITAPLHRNRELAARAAVAEAVLAVADELAKLRQLLAERLPKPPSLRLPEPRHFGVRAKRRM